MLSVREEDLKKILPTDGPSISEVKNYLNKYNDEYIVIKCGGSVLVDQNLFNHFIANISILNKLGFIPIIVHGGGKRISNKLSKAGIKSDFLNGLRITDKNTIKIVEEVLIEFNKEIVIALKNKGCAAEEMNTKNNNIFTVIKNDEKLGFVGTPNQFNKQCLDNIIDQKKIPVIAPLGIDDNNRSFNINADTAAGYIAKQLNARRLIVMSDVEGVLNKEKSLISEMNSKVIKKLIDDGTISGGMIPKINNCLDVASNGVKGVVIIDGRKKNSILFELLSDEGSGTLIRQ